MTKLPNQEFRKMVSKLREKGFYEHEEPREISWPEYNLSQIEDAKETLEFIKKSVNKTKYLNTRGKPGRPLTDPKSLAKAILACEALGFTERGAQGWLEILGPFLEIPELLDDRTIGDAYDKIEVLYILKQVFGESKTSDGKLSGDGTGLETSRKQNYESEKRKQNSKSKKKQNAKNKKKTGDFMTSIVDSREIVQAFNIDDHENKAMHKLIENVYGNTLCLDAGFNDRKLVKKIAEKGMLPYVFPKKNNKLNGSLAWKQMYLELFFDVMQWLTEYHQRSHSESFHSSIKRIYGTVTKERITCKLNQVTARIILHNRRRLSYFKKLAKAN